MLCLPTGASSLMLGLFRLVGPILLTMPDPQDARPTICFDYVDDDMRTNRMHMHRRCNLGPQPRQVGVVADQAQRMIQPVLVSLGLGNAEPLNSGEINGD